MTAEEDAPYSVAINIDGAPSPEYTLELAQAFAEIARCLNHQTMHHEALEYPAEAYRVVQELSSAAERLPQLCDQTGRWAAIELAAGKIEVTYGEYAGRPDAAVAAFQVRLDHARAAFAEAQYWLNLAASVAGTLAAAETGDE